MNRVILNLIFVSFILITSFSASAQRQCSCGGVELSDEEFREYTANFKTFFFNNPTDKKHTEWVFLHKNYFELFYRFLNSTNSDGLWIYFLSTERKIDLGQQTHDEQILFNVVASINGRPDFNRLKDYASASQILNTGNQIFLSTAPSNITTSRIKHDFLLKRSESTILSDSFRYKLQNKVVKYSERLYICKRQIEQIYNSIQGLGMGGVKFYFASYNKIIPCVGNIDSMQLTLVLAPVKNKNAQPNFKKYNDYLFKLGIAQTEKFNHGSLCPNDCQ